MNELLGLYIDHQMTAPLAVAQLSEKIKPLAADLGRAGILLVATCARVEVYSDATALRDVNSMIFSDFSYGRVEGADAVAERLAEIASSAHSQILGESYISQQLAKATEFVTPNSLIFPIARYAIDTGRAVRERQQFIASFNYDQIVEDIIADRFPNGELPDRLYVIGAGMLGCGLIRSDVGKRFRSKVVVTRNPKNLRKRLRPWVDIEVALMRPTEIGYAREPQSVVVVATADVNDEYEATLRDALLRLEPRTIVDLSSVPVFSAAAVRDLNYVSMYDDEFLRFIEQNNNQLTPKLPLVFSDIKATLQSAQIDLRGR
ncbi:hypothetical protein [Bradyrhizobium sp. WSM3983]|uniref:hypothetical protein n=1 Tax=Bradyrhizobium sp. WSM3983 TaxID=1038867 RepID=UPI000486AE52|nr:hypothetical protein [Bradyrhizobium sp. WSM3983]